MRRSVSELRLYLHEGRQAKEMSLRAVEEATGISNAYLSQLESGKILKPSPSVLHKLCEVYGLSYTKAMVYAGYPMPGDDNQNIEESHKLAARLGPTTEDEEEALVEYLAFLRSRRKRGGNE